jgi:membrane-bound ClpP family serine protease
MGTSIRLLRDADEMQSPMGASLVAASMLDDVISLIAMSVLLAIGNVQQSTSVEQKDVQMQTNNATMSNVTANDHTTTALAIASPLIVAIVASLCALLLLNVVVPFGIRRLPARVVGSSRVLLLLLSVTTFLGSMLAGML